jgi:hypothetical protein
MLKKNIMKRKAKLRVPRLNDNNHVVLVFAIGLFLFCFGVFVAHIYKIYDSDDVAQQVLLKNISLTARLGLNHRMFYGGDSFIIKFPFYWVMNFFIYGTRKELLAECMILAASGYVLFYWSAYWLLDNFSNLSKSSKKVAILPLLWVSCLGVFFFTLFVNPNLRNIEIGVDFAVLALLLYLFMIEKNKWREYNNYLKLIIGIFLTAGLGLFFYSDPWSQYVMFLPLLILLVIRFPFINKQDRISSFNITAILAVAFLFEPIWRRLFTHFGYVSPNRPAQLAHLSTIGSNLNLSIQGIYSILNINFWATNTVPFIVLIKLIGFILFFAVVIAHFNPGVRKSLKTNFLHQFLILQIFITIAAFAFSTNPVDLSTTRYFVIIPFSLAIIVSLAVVNYTGRFRKKMLVFVPIMTIALAITSLHQDITLIRYRFNPIAVTDFTVPVPLQPEQITAAGNFRNQLNIKIAQIAEANGLTKGYADYWSAPVDTFFSANKVQFLPLWCNASNQIAPYYLLLDTSTLNNNAKTTFFLYNSASDFSSSDLWCGSPSHFLPQFGSPNKIIPVNSTVRFYIYNFDILKKMQAST